MRARLLKFIGAFAVILSVAVLLRPAQVTVAQQAPAVAAKAAASNSALAVSLKTPWGEPDLQGIWMDESDTPLQALQRIAGEESGTDPGYKVYALQRLSNKPSLPVSRLNPFAVTQFVYALRN